MVINTCGWIRGEGYNQIKHIAKAFEVAATTTASPLHYHQTITTITAITTTIITTTITTTATRWTRS